VNLDRQNITSLADLKKNQKGIIKSCSAEGMLKQKLINMGFIPGTEICMIRNAPLRDPLEIRIQDYLLTLRRNVALLIELELETQ
jgi:ferrous iron transport protein A